MKTDRRDVLASVMNALSPKPISTVQVTRTYLELREPGDLRPARSDDPSLRVEQIVDCSVSTFRHLYSEVGRNYHWVDRLPWTDDEVQAHLRRPEISIWLMTCDAEAAGYFELRGCGDDSVEVAYFGLLPDFIGRGLGKHLLTCAVEQAWNSGANRVWLHTCTLDDKAAMPNYLKRGFRPFKTEEYLAELFAKP
jgi:GNAT superfamily N-acetyltransferase